MVVGEAHDVGGAGEGNAAQNHLADLDLRRNGDVDRQVVTAEEIGIFRPQIVLRTNTGDLGRDVEERMGDLAGGHVDFVVERDGNQHFGLIGAGPRQHIRMGAVADITADIQRLGDMRDERGGGVDDRDVVAFLGEPLGNAVTDLARAADDDFHSMLPAPGSVLPDSVRPLIRQATSVCDGGPSVPCRRILPCVKCCHRND